MKFKISLRKIQGFFQNEYQKLKNAKANTAKFIKSEFFLVLFGESSIHGMLHIVAPKRHFLERYKISNNLRRISNYR